MDRVGKLRIVYWLALANVGVLSVWGVAFDVPGVIGSLGLGGPNAPAIIFGVDAFLVLCFLIVAGLIGLLIRQPMGWGKLLLPFGGVAWIMHGAILTLMGTMTRPALHVAGLWVPIACGLAMFGLAIAHQIIDPSFIQPGPA